MISLIIAAYNVKPYLDEFLNSVINQTFKDFEAVLVDDGSTDGTGAVLDEYAEKYNFLKVIHKENGGVVSAWKKGIENSTGEYITFADPDDIMVENALEAQHRLMVQNNVDLVITGIKRLENGVLVSMPADNWGLAEGVYSGESLEHIKKNLFGNAKKSKNIFFFARWNKLFRRDIVLKNLKYSKDNIVFGEDVCISASAIYDSKGIFYSKEELYIYRIRENSLTTVNFDVRQIDNVANLNTAVLNLINDKGYISDFIIYNDISDHFMRLMRKIIGLPIKRKEKKKFLKLLRNHRIVSAYNLKNAKKYISKKRYFAIWILKHSMFGLLLTLLK